MKKNNNSLFKILVILFMFIIIVLICYGYYKNRDTSISHSDFNYKMGNYLLSIGYECDRNDDGSYSYCMCSNSNDSCNSLSAVEIGFNFDRNYFKYNVGLDGSYIYNYYYLNDTLDFYNYDSINQTNLKLEIIYNFTTNSYNCININNHISYMCNSDEIVGAFDTYEKFYSVKSTYLSFLDQSNLDAFNIYN